MPSLTDAELPTLPQVALLLIEMCGDPEVDLDDIVETISLDVALSAALIRTANSAHYGQQYRVDTLRKAAMVVGTSYVKAVALGFQLAEASSHWKDVPIDLGILWRGNLLRSCLARYIAQGSSLPALADQGQAFLVGLLQDLAVPIAARRVGSEYTAWLGEDGLYTTDTLVEAERIRIDDDHASLADALCRKWEFPDSLTEAIRRHHQSPPDRCPDDEAHCLWQVAHWVGAIRFAPGDLKNPAAAELPSLSLGGFELDPATLTQAYTAAIEEYEMLHPVFAHRLPKGTQAESLLHSAADLAAEVSPDT